MFQQFANIECVLPVSFRKADIMEGNNKNAEEMEITTENVSLQEDPKDDQSLIPAVSFDINRQINEVVCCKICNNTNITLISSLFSYANISLP